MNIPYLHNPRLPIGDLPVAVCHQLAVLYLVPIRKPCGVQCIISKVSVPNSLAWIAKVWKALDFSAVKPSGGVVHRRIISDTITHASVSPVKKNVVVVNPATRVVVK